MTQTSEKLGGRERGDDVQSSCSFDSNDSETWTTAQFVGHVSGHPDRITAVDPNRWTLTRTKLENADAAIHGDRHNELGPGTLLNGWATSQERSWFKSWIDAGEDVGDYRDLSSKQQTVGVIRKHHLNPWSDERDGSYCDYVCWIGSIWVYRRRSMHLPAP